MRAAKRSPLAPPTPEALQDKDLTPAIANFFSITLIN